MPSWFGTFTLPDGRESQPLIIPPMLDKPIREAPLGSVWAVARETLAEARHIVVIGYSFPPTDFHVRSLIRDATAGGCLESVTVVDPNPDSDRVTDVFSAANAYTSSRFTSLSEYLSATPIPEVFGIA